MVLAWLFAACTAPELPAPQVDRIEPSFAFNGRQAAVTILGHDFLPQVTIDAGDGGVDVDPAYDARLVGPDGADTEYDLVGVNILDSESLAATVPSGLPAGWYDVVVENASGHTDALPSAFEVSAIDPRRLQATALVQPFTEVGGTIDVVITLVDAVDAQVAVSFGVVISAEPEFGLTDSLQLEPVSLDAPVFLGATTLRGDLLDGAGVVSISSSTAGAVTLSVQPAQGQIEVAGDEVEVTFLGGDDVHVQLLLPAGVAQPYAAGQVVPMTARLVDDAGNLLALGTKDAPFPVGLTTECLGWNGEVELVAGVGTFDLVPTTPTATAVCPSDRVIADENAVGSSAPFQVVPGEAERFDVSVFAVPAQAGDVVQVVATPTDEFLNPTVWTGDVEVTDSVQGAQLQTCASSSDGKILCDVRVVRAGTGVVMYVLGDDGTFGQSSAFDVAADDVPGGLSVSMVGPAEAGVPLSVGVEVFDTFGNTIPADQLDEIGLSDLLGDADCDLIAVEADGSATFDCVFTQAGQNVLVGTASNAGAGVNGGAVPLLVVNGSLAFVDVSGEAQRTAGVSFSLSLAGTDAYGNPYVVGANPVVDLRDDSGTYSATTATLGASGGAAVNGAITRAGLTSVRVSQGGVDLGESSPFLVVAAAPAALRVTPGAPWAWVDEPLDVTVELVDAYGNRSGASTTATLSSDATSSPDVAVSLVGGVGTAPYVWSSDAFPDTLSASGGGWSGAVDLAVSARCEGGPAVGISFAGFSDAVACLDGDGLALVTADLSSSAAGAAPLAGYGFAEPGAWVTLSDLSAIDATLVGPGAHDLLGLAVDEDGCGAEVETTGWVGPDDGTPVGDILLSPVPVTMGVFDSMVVDVVGVVDCSRDPAGLQEVLVRATGGALLGGAATGEGLAIVLDAAGDGSFTVDTDGSLSAGDIEVHATVATGAAGGFVAVPLSGDDVRPVVVEQDPVGITLGPVDHVTLRFSEELLSTSVAASSFQVTGPTNVSVTSATLIEDGRAVQISLSPAADGGAGVYTVVATTALRDLGGSRLSGDWTGLAADYQGGFGDVASAPPAVTCSAFDPAGLLFRPDGDDGAGPERDSLRMTVAAASAPARWALSVRDGADALVWHARTAPVAATDSVVWDGRGLDGLVVPNGAYTIEVRGEDGIGTGSVGCEVQVTVDNRDGRAPVIRP